MSDPLHRIRKGEVITASFLNRKLHGLWRNIEVVPPLAKTVTGGGTRLVIRLAKPIINQLVVVGKLRGQWTNHEDAVEFEIWRWSNDEAKFEPKPSGEVARVVSWLEFGDNTFSSGDKITAVRIPGAVAGPTKQPLYLLLGVSCEDT